MKTIQKSVPVQTVLFLLMDAIFIIVAGGLALLVRFDFDFEQVPSGYLEPWFRALPVHGGGLLAAPDVPLSLALRQRP